MSAYRQELESRVALVLIDYNDTRNNDGPRVQFAYIPDDDARNFAEYTPLGGHWYRWVYFLSPVADPHTDYPAPPTIPDIDTNPDFSNVPQAIGSYALAVSPVVYLQLQGDALPSGSLTSSTCMESERNLAFEFGLLQQYGYPPVQVDPSGVPWDPQMPQDVIDDIVQPDGSIAHVPRKLSLNFVSGAYVYRPAQQDDLAPGSFVFQHQESLGPLNFYRLYAMPDPEPQAVSTGVGVIAPGWPDPYGARGAPKGSSLTYE